MKRKILSLALAVVLALSLIPTAAFAADSDFVIENGILTRYTGSGGAVVIPDYVSEIGRGAFSYKDVTSVIVGAGVATISDSAFQCCRSLTSVTLPEGLVAIGDEAFDTCDKLTSITLPSSLTTIGFSAFHSSGLTSITIPYNIKSIGGRAFEWCKDLQNVVFLNPDVEIGFFAFYETPWQKSLGEFAIANHTLLRYQGSAANVVIPSGITKIGDGAFERVNGKNENLTSVTIPSGVKEIGSRAFYTASLTNVIIPDSVTTIGDWAFDQTNLSSVILPPNIKAIGKCTFNWCKELTTITIPDGVQTIGDEAFSKCENLTSAIIPASVVEIAGWAFSRCDALTIYGAPGSRAESYAKKGYEYLDGKLGGTFYRRYQAIPFVAIENTAGPVEISGAENISPWARAEIEIANQMGLIVPSCAADMTGSITRQQFAELAVNLVETKQGGSITPAPEGTFSDCKNVEVLKAYSAGIVTGAGNGVFAPSDTLNREQLAAMLYRAWKVVGTPTPSAGLGNYTDAADVSSWSVEGVGSLAAAGIMKGASATTLTPQAPCTVEQAILLVYRLYTELIRPPELTPWQRRQNTGV